MKSLCIHHYSNNSEIDFVEIFPDELPLEEQNVIDILGGQYASMRTWKDTALEYYRRGKYEAFESILETIIYSLGEVDVQNTYKDNESSDSLYKDTLIEIYNALAAHYLNLYRLANSEQSRTEALDKTVKYIKQADEHNALCEYTLLIKSFSEILKGEAGRAEPLLKTALAKAPELQFGIFCGLGAVSYNLKRYPIALEHFIKAVTTLPTCGAGPRVAIASCCFVLEQYDRARSATKAALSIEPDNVDALLLFALLDRVEALKDKHNRTQLSISCADLLSLASVLAPASAMASNHKALLLLYKWISVDGDVIVMNETTLFLRGHLLSDCHFAVNDMLLLNHSVQTNVLSIALSDDCGGVIITVKHSLPFSNNTSLLMDFKPATKIAQLLRQGMISPVAGIQAESHYIMGKLHQLNGDNDDAFRKFDRCLQLTPDFPLAQFSLAQLLIERKEYTKSLSKFELLLLKYPQDNSMLAYVMYLKSLAAGSTHSPVFEKVKEATVDFVYDVELLLLQGKCV